ELAVHLHDVLVVLHLLADVPRHELEPLELGHVLEPEAEHLRRRELAVGLALHHLHERLVVAIVELVSFGEGHRGSPARLASASVTSAAIMVASLPSISSPSSAVASAGAPVYARSSPMARKLERPALIPSDRLVATAGRSRAAARSTTAGDAARTS